MQPGSRSASSSARPGASPLPRPATTHPNNQTHVLDTVAGRILCIADIRGRLSALNDMAKEANAKAIIHTGDFGFFEHSSLERINDRTLRHLTMYSPLIPNAQRTTLIAPETSPANLRSALSISILSEFPQLLAGHLKLNVPVYTVWGACEDVTILEKLRQGTYDIDNLNIIDESTTRCLDIGGVKLRLLGLGGAFVPHKMFDNGEGNATIAGGQGTMWTTALQIGELVDTAQRVFDPSETRLLITHASPGREGMIAQLALVLKADLTISAGLHFRYASSYNEFSVQADFEGFRHKLLAGKDGFDKVWESVKTQVHKIIDENQRILLEKALGVLERIPPAQANLGPGGTATGEEPSWKNCWNWNLCDAAYGCLVLDIKEGRVSAELKSQGFNYAYRRSVTPNTAVLTPNTASSPLPNASSVSVSNSATPAPNKQHPNNSKPMSRSTVPTPPSTTQHLPNEPQTGKETPKANGTPTGTASPVLSSAANADFKKKDKKKDKRDGKRDRDSNTPTADESVSGEQSAVNDAASEADKPDSETVPLSPGGTESTGMRTPITRKPSRNPWTLYVRMPNPATDAELREFFGEAKSGITRLIIPNVIGNSKRHAYVEFGDEEAMKAGLEKHAPKLNGGTPVVNQAGEHPAGSSGSMRGRGRGRGGLAARGFAQVGLTRPPPDRKSGPNGDSKEGS